MIKKRMPDASIIFATAFRDYAVKAFEIGAMDYLLKPFDYERVKKTMERIREQMKEKPQSSEYEINKIMVNAETGYRVVDAAKIVYIETEKRACKIHMDDGSFYLQNESLNNYENILRKCRFPDPQELSHQSGLCDGDAGQLQQRVLCGSQALRKGMPSHRQEPNPGVPSDLRPIEF